MGADPSESVDDEGVVRPEDLDFTDDERVAELPDGRFVVATSVDERPDPSAWEDGELERTVATRGEAAREELANYVEEVRPSHGFSITGAFDGRVAQREVFSNDISTAFEALLSWYAAQVDDDTPPEDVLGVLLLAADVPVRYPDRAVHDLLDAHDLGPGDSIADLLDSLAADGLRLPPRDRGPDD